MRWRRVQRRVHGAVPLVDLQERSWQLPPTCVVGLLLGGRNLPGPLRTSKLLPCRCRHVHLLHLGLRAVINRYDSAW
jgi:hypothetical protein